MNNEWQPIETAPRDEHTEILMYLGKREPPEVNVGWWREGVEDEDPRALLVTHWMPLPEPPK